MFLGPVLTTTKTRNKKTKGRTKENASFIGQLQKKKIDVEIPIPPFSRFVFFRSYYRALTCHAMGVPNNRNMGYPGSKRNKGRARRVAMKFR